MKILLCMSEKDALGELEWDNFILITQQGLGPLT